MTRFTPVIGSAGPPVDGALVADDGAEPPFGLAVVALEAGFGELDLAAVEPGFGELDLAGVEPGFGAADVVAASTTIVPCMNG